MPTESDADSEASAGCRFCSAPDSHLARDYFMFTEFHCKKTTYDYMGKDRKIHEGVASVYHSTSTRYKNTEKIQDYIKRNVE